MQSINPGCAAVIWWIFLNGLFVICFSRFTIFTVECCTWKSRNHNKKPVKLCVVSCSKELSSILPRRKTSWALNDALTLRLTICIFWEHDILSRCHVETCAATVDGSEIQAPVHMAKMSFFTSSFSISTVAGFLPSTLWRHEVTCSSLVGSPQKNTERVAVGGWI